MIEALDLMEHMKIHRQATTPVRIKRQNAVMLESLLNEQQLAMEQSSLLLQPARSFNSLTAHWGYYYRATRNSKVPTTRRASWQSRSFLPHGLSEILQATTSLASRRELPCLLPATPRCDRRRRFKVSFATMHSARSLHHPSASSTQAKPVRSYRACLS